MPAAAIGAVLAGRRNPAASAARAGAWMLALWAAVFGGLAIVQRRYGNDFGPSAAVGFARRNAVNAQHEGNVFEHGLAPEQLEVLKNDSDFAA